MKEATTTNSYTTKTLFSLMKSFRPKIHHPAYFMLLFLAHHEDDAILPKEPDFVLLHLNDGIQIMKEKLHLLFSLLTLSILGISTGAMLGEQQTLVPFWRELSLEAFYTWYAANASRLKGFFAPLQIAGAIMAVITAVFFHLQKRPGRRWMVLSACSALAVLLTFFLFFRKTNAGFVARSFSAEQLPVMLKSWSLWQWGRIGLGSIAFIAAILGFFQMPSDSQKPQNE